MKLRQKLAAILAASMVVTAVPVITLADTSNSINCDIKVRDGSTLGFYKSDKVTIVDEGKAVTTPSAVVINNSDGGEYAKTNIPNLELYPKDDYLSTNQTFFIELEDGEFDFSAYLAANENQQNGEFTKVSELGGSGDSAVRVYEKDGKAFSYTKGDVEKDIVKLDDVVPYTGSVEDEVLNKEILKYNNKASEQNFKDGSATFTLTGSKQMRVDIKGDWLTSDRNHNGTPILVPLFVNAKSTQVKVKIDGDSSFVTTGTETIGVANEEGKEITITADDAKTAIPVDGGEISKLIISEEVLNAIKYSENRQIRLELPTSSDLEWDLDGIKATGKRAFSGKEEEDVKATYGRTGRYGSQDKQVLIIQLPNWSDSNARGVIELTGINVEPTDDTAQTGELEITVSAVNDDDFAKEKSLTVGVVAEYDITLTCDKPVSIKAGRSGIVNKYSIEAVLEESVKDSLVTGRDIKFTLENGYIIGVADILAYTDKESYTFDEPKTEWDKLTDSEKLDYLIELLEESGKDYYNSVSNSSPKSTRYEVAALKAIQHLVDTEKIKFSEDGSSAEIKSVEVNKDGQVIGFTIDGDSVTDKVKNDEKDKIKIKMPVATSLQSKGEVKLIASGRALAELGEEDQVSCKIADIIEPIKVDITAAELKVGLQDQTTGSITINETDKGMIEKGTIIVDANPQDQYGIKFEKTPKVEATNLKLGDVALSADKRFLYIEVEKTSTEAGKISITDASFTTDRTVPEGTFPVRFYGSALTDEDVKTYDATVWDKYVVEDFIKITTPNTEDIKNGALKAVTSTFKIGSSVYTVDGVEHQMDAPAYLKDNRTMVPVRYLAYAFGLNTENVTFAKGTATIIAGEKVIQVKLGSDILSVNGSSIQMDAKAELVNGRAYVPMKFIAAALGVSSNWDSATQTATFSNVATK